VVVEGREIAAAGGRRGVRDLPESNWRILNSAVTFYDKFHNKILNKISSNIKHNNCMTIVDEMILSKNPYLWTLILFILPNTAEADLLNIKTWFWAADAGFVFRPKMNLMKIFCTESCRTRKCQRRLIGPRPWPWALQTATGGQMLGFLQYFRRKKERQHWRFYPKILLNTFNTFKILSFRLMLHSVLWKKRTTYILGWTCPHIVGRCVTTNLLLDIYMFD
jgi:hypothetical protein